MGDLKRYRRCLSIAGSDPSGGAGLQADLKTFSALGCYGMTAVTAVVDENTVGVTDVYPLPPEFVAGQIRSCLDDIGADAVKVGMLHSAALVDTVAETLTSRGARNIVLDPVMVATSGDALAEDGIADALRRMMAMARIITPNLPEAETLLGRAITAADELADAARELSRMGGGVSVLLKGGHLSAGDTVTDVLLNGEDGGTISVMESPRIDTRNTHGTGCTLSSAVASFLARGAGLADAARLGHDYVAAAIAAGAQYAIGGGCGPVHHFHGWWE